jgi:hypothetical protein
MKQGAADMTTTIRRHPRTTIEPRTTVARPAVPGGHMHTITSLMAHEVTTLPVAMVAEGIELGVLLPGPHGAGWTAVERHCTDCGEALPLLTATHRVDGPLFDLFPRCSRHMF